MGTISIYTDGSCNYQDGTGAWAFVSLLDGVYEEQACFESKTKTNRMELSAILNALRWLDTRSEDESTVRIFSDSEYSIKAIDSTHRYKQIGWKTFQGEDVANQDLLRAIIALLDKHRENRAITITWVAGHSKNDMNEKADYLAGTARRFRFRGYRKSGPIENKIVVTPLGEVEIAYPAMRVIAGSDKMSAYVDRFTYNIFKTKPWHHLINPPLMTSVRIKLAGPITLARKSPLGMSNSR